MKLLFTGASGFLGTNIKPILQKQYDVVTVGVTDSDDYRCDISKHVPVITEVYDIVLHAAGKAHSVPKTEEQKKVFFDVNYQGTVNLCKALEKKGVPRAFVFISTVAVYGVEFGEDISEEHPLNGNTPYALSKIQAEEFLQKWCAQNGVILGIIRPCLLAGRNPLGNLGSMISGIKSGKYLNIAGGKARKSMLMVEDIACLIPLTAQKGGIFNVCDNEHPSFKELESLITRQLGKRMPFSIPYSVAKCLALLGDVMGPNAVFSSLKLNKMTRSLTFSSQKAQRELGWKPLNVLESFRVQ